MVSRLPQNPQTAAILESLVKLELHMNEQDKKTNNLKSSLALMRNSQTLMRTVQLDLFAELTVLKAQFEQQSAKFEHESITIISKWVAICGFALVLNFAIVLSK